LNLILGEEKFKEEFGDEFNLNFQTITKPDQTKNPSIASLGYVLQGIKWCQDGEPKEACTFLKKAYEQDPANTDAIIYFQEFCLRFDMKQPLDLLVLLENTWHTANGDEGLCPLVIFSKAERLCNLIHDDKAKQFWEKRYVDYVSTETSTSSTAPEGVPNEGKDR
jgi:hypothetical protein